MISAHPFFQTSRIASGQTGKQCSPLRVGAKKDNNMKLMELEIGLTTVDESWFIARINEILNDAGIKEASVSTDAVDIIAAGLFEKFMTAQKETYE